ncbi:MAG: porin [Inquilinus sp.]|nr:porin [Inquilinus sp.]
MKKLLLGSTALVAAGLIAGPAAAQLELSISGSVDFHMGISSEDEPAAVAGVSGGSRGYGFTTDTTLNIDADGVSDNGLEYGSRINIDDTGILSLDTDDTLTGTTAVTDLFATGLQIDEAYVFVSGSFGQLRFGNTDPAASELRFVMPTVGNGQADGDFERYLIGEGKNAFGTDFAHDSDATKIVYLGDFGDFTVGASFTPNDTLAQGSFPSIGEFDGDLENVISLGANYNGTFGGTSIGVSGGYNMGDIVGIAPNSGGDHTEFGVGAEVGLGAITVGGFWIDSEQEDSSGVVAVDRMRYGLGASFSTGPWSFAANALIGENDATAASTTDGGEDTVYGVGLEYSLAPGLTPYADLVIFDFDDNSGVATDDNDGSVFIVGVTASF